MLKFLRGKNNETESTGKPLGEIFRQALADAQEMPDTPARREQLARVTRPAGGYAADMRTS